MTTSLAPLPIDPLLPELVARLRENPQLVLEAPPGAGKTTRVPRALLDAGFARDGEIVVLQPRRLAARMAAKRVADELNEPIGKTVGYQVRFDEQSSADTRVRFVTEGVLTRRLLSDKRLRGVACVVLDEFHERHIDGDVALGALTLLRRERPELRLVVMSATLDAAPIAAYLGDVPTLRAEGRRFEVAMEYSRDSDDRPLELRVASALDALVARGLDGDVLVFLPGGAEIRRAAAACERIAQRHDLLVVPLHGELSAAEQDRAVRPADRRKVIVSTNVAETSVTIDGVVAVIDSGLARVASHAPWSGLPLLHIKRISRASATQRAGRAGRTRPGVCVRLYSKNDHDSRPAFDLPEIARLDLAQTALELRASGLHSLGDFPWFEPPSASAVAAATQLLTRLGALSLDDARVTDVGRSMLRFPVHPRLARMIVEGEQRGVSRDAAAMAALLSERDIRVRDGSDARDVERGDSDLTALLERFDDVTHDGRYDRARNYGLDAGSVASVDRVRKQLVRIARDRGAAPSGPKEYDHALRICALAGFPDRVGKLRRPANHTGRTNIEVVFAFGGTAKLSPSSVVMDADLVVAMDATEIGAVTGAKDSRASVVVRTASAIESDWLLELCTDEVRDESVLRFDPVKERVEARRRMTYGALVLEDSAEKKPDPRALTRCLLEAAIAKGLRVFADGDDFDRVLARAAFVRASLGADAMPALDDAFLIEALSEACAGMLSFEQLKKANLASIIENALSPEQQRALREFAPDRVELPGGRKVKVEYPQDGAPWIESRLQDFFGMADGPRIARGRVALVLHLLAPNYREVQVTTDLAGFWERHYPAVAKELRRKYPRHPFPDDPLHAEPPAPKRR